MSTGYWSSEQNIYSGWNYMDRSGNVFTAEECREELHKYKETDDFKALQNTDKPSGVNYFIQAGLLKIKRGMRIG